MGPEDDNGLLESARREGSSSTLRPQSPETRQPRDMLGPPRFLAWPISRHLLKLFSDGRARRRKIFPMRVSLKLIISLIVVTAAVAYIFAFFEVRTESRALRHEIKSRAERLGGYLQDKTEPLLSTAGGPQLLQLLTQVENRDGLYGVAVYDDQGNLLVETPSLAGVVTHTPSGVVRATVENGGREEFLQVGPAYLYVYAVPLHHGAAVIGALGIFYDAGYIREQNVRLWRTTFWTLLIELLLIVAIVFFVIRWSFAGPISRTAQWIREMRKGESLAKPPLPDDDLFKPLAEEVGHLAKTLTAARAAAEEEARLRNSAESHWTAERLRIHVRSKLKERPLFLIANREPYIHVHNGKQISVMVPPSGLVTAIEPILFVCDGTWIAHGSGDADRETVDSHDRLRVPPDDPHYTLRRVWLDPEEEEGYYFGFANEGLWPLCHIAHTRPIFRASDWEQYEKVNRKFASATLEEMRETENPFVLVQDYHFALLPRLIKAERPDARVAIFWHIPWPNPQAFGICPWQRELLDGLLGADLVGFHIQSHCNYFLETVDAALESRIDWDRFAVNRHGHLTEVRRYPIGVGFTGSPAGEPREPPYLERAGMFKQLGVQALFMGVGVERVDYTKGIVERFRGIERFIEKYPAYRGQFTFVQIGAPSRTRIKRYQDLLGEIRQEAERINQRFQSVETPEWKPIVYLERQHSHKEIDAYYKAADVCMVTSLHDGMNLVAKEFVAARDDEQGALILSQFAGAARELHDAYIVNPYDTEALAEAIRVALESEPEERQERMRRMRRALREHNIYRWAAAIMTDLSDLRIEAQAAPAAPRVAETAR